MKINVIKVISLAGTALGVVGTLVTSWAEDKKLDNKVAEAVAEALKNNK